MKCKEIIKKQCDYLLSLVTKIRLSRAEFIKRILKNLIAYLAIIFIFLMCSIGNDHFGFMPSHATSILFLVTLPALAYFMVVFTSMYVARIRDIFFGRSIVLYATSILMFYFCVPLLGGFVILFLLITPSNYFSSGKTNTYLASYEDFFKNLKRKMS